MSTQIVRVPIPGAPVISAVRETVGWTVNSVSFLLSLPVRLATLLTTVEKLVISAQQLMLVISDIVEASAQVTARADAVAGQAEVTVERTTELVAAAGEMITELQPIAQKLLPHAALIADSLSPEEVKALIDMIDRLPELEQSAEALLPILATMESVAPELHQLLLTTEDLRHAVVGMPGFKFLRGRGQAKLREEDS